MPKILAGLVVVAALSSCGGSGAPVVEMVQGQMFQPEEITLSAGERISFENTSSEAHTVTAYAHAIPDDADYFSSGGSPSEGAARADVFAGLVLVGDVYEVTLDVPGTYRYFCIPHEGAGMKGSIVVER